MNAEKVIFNRLSTNPSLNAIVPSSRVYASIIPIDAILPSIAYSLVSQVQMTKIGLTKSKERSRVQVTVATKTYKQVKEIVALVKLACNLQRGTFNGVKTDSIILDNVGADFRDDKVGVFYSTVDFVVTHD